MNYGGESSLERAGAASGSTSRVPVGNKLTSGRVVGEATNIYVCACRKFLKNDSAPRCAQV